MIDYGQAKTTLIRWWTGDVRGREHERLWQVVTKLRMQDAPRRDACLRRMRMYGNYAAWSTNNTSLPNDRLRYNLVKQASDTLLAEISSSKPKATFLAIGGDWTLRQAAMAADKLIEAQMRDEEIYDGKARAWLKDALITGTGILYDYVDRKKLVPRVERVLPLELLVDQADGRYGKPRCMYRQRLVDRGVLLDLYAGNGAKTKAIREATRFSPIGSDEWLMPDAGESDLVLVVDAWHLPSGDGADDGRFVRAIENATLDSCEWEDCDFPFTVLHFEEAPFGFWGVGVVEQLESDQVELNRTLKRIQESAGVAAGLWTVNRGAKIKLAHFTDVPGVVLEHNGAKPEWIMPPTVPPDLINHADRIIARGLQRLGINEMLASASMPTGILGSGEAQRVYSNSASKRQVEHSQRWDSAHVALAKRLVKRNHEIWEMLTERKNKRGDDDAYAPLTVSVKVQRGRRTVLKRLRWDEATLPENKYVIEPFPTSTLPSEPAGRAALLKEWMDGGLIDQQTAKAMQQLPDTDGALKLELADYDFALFAYETMVEDGKYVPPEPYQSLDQGLELMRRSYLRGVIDGVPESRLDLVRDHMDAIQTLMAKAAAPTAPAPAVPDPALDMTQALPPAGLAPDAAGLDPTALEIAA